MQNPLENPIQVAPSQMLMNPENMDSLKKVAGVQYGELAIHVVGAGIDAIQGAGYDTTVGAQIALQSLQDQKPKDVVEARLIAQGAALYANGMDYIARANRSNMQSHFESYANLAIKLLRLHNETIDALGRYRRGSTQQIIVQHQNNVVSDKAVFNSIGVGVFAQNQGESPCPQQNAEPKPEPISIDHVDSPQWPTGDADCMGEKATVLKQQQVCKG